MVFICQTDSYLKEYVAKVEKIEKTDDGKQFVIFNDTVLFPEGLFIEINTSELMFLIFNN